MSLMMYRRRAHAYCRTVRDANLYVGHEHHAVVRRARTRCTVTNRRTSSVPVMRTVRTSELSNCDVSRTVTYANVP